MRIGLALLLLLMPGLALWACFGGRRRDAGEALATVFAVSLGFYSLLALVLFTFHLPLPIWAFALIGGLFVIPLVWGLINRGVLLFKPKDWLVPALLLGLALVWRLWQAGNLVLPNWVDPQHHALIVRKMIEYGGLPATLEPYLPGPFYYHYSFHLLTALFSVVSGLDPAQSMLIFGQIVSALLSLSLYSLVMAMGKDRRIAVLAALFSLFVTRMPGYYLSWGRYTLMIGLLLLLATMAEAWRVLWRGQYSLGSMVCLTLMVFGTLISHYLTALLLGIFFILVLITWIFDSARQRFWNWGTLLSIGLPAVLGLLFSARWYYRVLAYTPAFAGRSLSIPTTGLQWNSELWGYIKYLIGPQVGWVLGALALLTLLWVLLHKDWSTFAFWSLLVIFFSLPIGLQLLSFRSDIIALVLFVPASLLGAVGLSALSRFVESLIRSICWKLVYRACVAVLLLGLLVWGGIQNGHAINPSTVLVTDADRAALIWINEHLPEDARFLVNTTGWGYGLYRGVDGGGWILPFTGRWSTAPTTFYPYGADAETSALWTDYARRASNLKTCDADFNSLLDDAGLNYIYLRAGVGSLQEEALQNCAGLRRLYSGGGVSIWIIAEADIPEPDTSLDAHDDAPVPTFTPQPSATPGALTTPSISSPPVQTPTPSPVPPAEGYPPEDPEPSPLPTEKPYG